MAAQHRGSAADSLEDLFPDLAASPSGWGRIGRLSAAAALVVIAVWAGLAWYNNGVYGVLESADGSVYRTVEGAALPVFAGERIRAGEVLHSDDAGGGVLKLRDGSSVEMRAQSQLSLERANDGIRIHLRKGGLIVKAARQRDGHLYVQTKDLTVSVVGTVFLVNAEEEGSRVAVIEGEVRVRRGESEKMLQRGEQLTTGPLMEPQPVKDEISWSRDIVAHVALLQEPAPQTAPPATGAVTGIVRNAAGMPERGIRVTAIRTDAADTALRAMTSLALTDDQGRFRLETIPPGSYYITAGRVDQPTFYPGTLDLTRATPVSISSAATIPEINFVIDDASMAPDLSVKRLSLRLQNPAGDVAVIREALSGRILSITGTGLTRKTRVQSSVDWWLDSALLARLGLTDDQAKKIGAIADRYRQSLVQNRTVAELEAMTARASAEALLVLTDAQIVELQNELPFAGSPAFRGQFNQGLQRPFQRNPAEVK
jgi:hypothetical protein